jgi:hypothetical protein
MPHDKAPSPRGFSLVDFHAKQCTAASGIAGAGLRRLEQEAKFFNDFSRAHACACAQGGVHSESVIKLCSHRVLRAFVYFIPREWISRQLQYGRVLALAQSR